ncbi:PREDICTED: complex I intermediate-associated protein 30, mitochondrial [Habropoda laboriosa]|nr:PREDICTED: complex I intermediate-associated protein 30, mitochondrial [Habropoda laboriosa]
MFPFLNPRLRILLINKRTIFEPPRSGYPVVYDKPPENLRFLARFRRACQEWKSEWNLYIQEFKAKLTLNPKCFVQNEDDIIWKFDGTKKSLDQWIVNSDQDYSHGYSTAKLELSSHGTGIFHGILDTRVPKDGRTVRSGYCNITSVRKCKSFKRKILLDWTNYNELVLRIRGDGRCYMLNLLCGQYFDITRNYAFHYVMYTRGGPHWQVVRIPFAKFLFASKGVIDDMQFPLTSHCIKNFGITLADKKPGPFKLEIDHISICMNSNLFETFAYEMYDIHK